MGSMSLTRHVTPVGDSRMGPWVFPDGNKNGTKTRRDSGGRTQVHRGNGRDGCRPPRVGKREHPRWIRVRGGPTCREKDRRKN